MTQKCRIELSLFLLRLGVFVVLFAWTLDKFINPAHAVKVFESFYLIGGLDHGFMYAVGMIEMIVILLFMAGIWKQFTYGGVFAIHGVSTLSSWKQFFVEPNLLFYAAWPMLAACAALYLLRDMDNLLTAKKR